LRPLFIFRFLRKIVVAFYSLIGSISIGGKLNIKNYEYIGSNFTFNIVYIYEGEISKSDIDIDEWFFNGEYIFVGKNSEPV